MSQLPLRRGDPPASCRERRPTAPSARRALRRAVAALVLAAAALAFPAAAPALTLPAGFEQTTAITGLDEPTDVELAPGGRVFVAEKSGLIRTYDTLADSTPHTFADLRTQVHNYSNRGLESLALDPDYPDQPYVYVFYVLDAPIGGTPPTFGSPGQTRDQCPGDTDEVNCLVSVRVSRLRAEGEDVSGPEQVLVNDWCQQFEFHPGGGMDFGADGNLYVAGGDGARWEIFDYGQLGNPPNPCGDPPGNAPGTVLTPPTAEGGRLRAQDLRTSGDPLGLNGSLIRIDPDTGEGVLGNPMFGSAEPNARRMLAYGFRNPVALAVRPGTNDVWVADRGGGYFEELDRVPDPADPVRNFGWPCYEGGMDANGNPYPRIRPRSNDQDLDICENLYDEVTATEAPYWAYDHEQPVVPGEDCAINPGTGDPAGNQISGVAFYPASGSFPPPYRRALFFTDRWRNCIYAMLAGPDGVPDRGQVIPFAQHAGEPFALETVPGGDLLYVDRSVDAVQRVSFPGGTVNQPPTAVAQADATAGDRPLTVNFDGTGSSDPDIPAGDVLAYEWDLDGDGELDDSTAQQPTFTYTVAGTYTVTLRVTDTAGAADTDTLTITVASAPFAAIDSPAGGATWGAGEAISFAGHAVDDQGNEVPAAGLDWTVVLRHCAGADCHEHPIGEFPDVAGGTFTAPDHPQPGDIEVRLTVTYPDSTTDVKTVALAPRTVNVSLGADPAGAHVTLNGESVATPATQAVVSGSTNSLTAPTSQALDNRTYRFSSWSDGQSQTRSFVATANQSFTATFVPVEPGTRTLTFAPEADTRAEATHPTTNFGTETIVRTDDNVESYLRFQVAGVAGKVTAAKLRLRAVTESIDGPILRGVGNSWSETGLTWQNRPAPSTATVSDAGPIDPGDWVEWDVTPLVAADGAVSFHLSQSIDDGVNFHSREASTPANRPQLLVTVTNDAYARPQAASPLRVSLVPAYEPCTAPNREHGPPLSHPSCSAPQPSSPTVTVGSPDANGAAAASVGFVKYSVRVGDPATPEDEADVALLAEISDVREASGLLDYLGELQLRPSISITDRANGPASDQPATVQAVPLPVSLPCAMTLGVAGSTCSVSTTLDAVAPGIVRERTRAIWELGQVELTDPGPDGQPGTPDDTVFARQGIFVP
jgi:PKD repeat protein/glucose/arabinose dehydrogenase